MSTCLALAVLLGLLTWSDPHPTRYRADRSAGRLQNTTLVRAPVSALTKPKRREEDETPMWGGPYCEVDGCPNPAPDYYTCAEHTEADNDYWDAVERGD